ncbi:helix-turn-helix domain-containing protein [Marinoscillum furvescens]|uniref:AraC-like DNA-binding protein n=1 Tax=Marinoscillum furvescens DSM 4134 TaxID=1122208 RepID=A0A3D9LJ02_MARFU|nr:AraC family transcriptional regulator [Marinoscillum furvescens]REE05793.1 AraC-like DNA-binding protein [Marinoscillum furvescens DSM 4134]
MSFNYYEQLPSEDLKGVVKKFFVIDYTANEITTDFLLPDGTPSLSYLFPRGYDIQGQFLGEPVGEVVFENSFYAGYGNTSLEFKHGPFKVVGANIYPVYLSLIFSIGSGDFMNNFVRVNTLKGFENVEEEVNFPEDDDQLGFQQIGDFVKSRLRSNAFLADFQKVHDRLIAPDGHLLSVEDLADFLGYSTRHLSNMFNRHMGMSPKKFLKLVRFNQVLTLMEQTDENLGRLAYEVGYHDQAHFIRDFKSICGKTPKELSAMLPDSLARKFRFGD